MSTKSEIILCYWKLVLSAFPLSSDAISITACKISTSSTTHPTPERKRQWWSTPTPRGSYSSPGRPVVQDAWSVLRARSATTYSRTTLCLSQRCSKQVSILKQLLLNGNVHKLQFENSGIIITTYILIEPKNLCWSLVKWWRFSSGAMWDSYFLQRKIMSGTLLVVIHSQEGQSKTFFPFFFLSCSSIAFIWVVTN